MEDGGKLAASVGHPKAERFSFSGGGDFAPDTLTRGYALEPIWRILPD